MYPLQWDHHLWTLSTNHSHQYLKILQLMTTILLPQVVRMHPTTILLGIIPSLMDMEIAIPPSKLLLRLPILPHFTTIKDNNLTFLSIIHRVRCCWEHLLWVVTLEELEVVHHLQEVAIIV